jgi:hypothetical protein
MDNIKIFYDEIRNMGFFKRLFSWNKIIPLLTESYSEIKKIEDLIDKNNELSFYRKSDIEKIEVLSDNLNKYEIQISNLEIEIKHLNQDSKDKVVDIATLKESDLKNEKTIRSCKEEIFSLKTDIRGIEGRRNDLIKETKELSNKTSKLESNKDEQQQRYDKSIARLEKREEILERRRQDLEDEQVRKETQKFEDMKRTWQRHEDIVEQSIKQICNKYTICYVDKEKVPFVGKPDNSVKIADEFIIFDAKSPANESLDNFPKYIKSQVDLLKKYIKEPNIKKDIYLVVPTNTIIFIDTTVYDMSDYRVYIITVDALEPILLSLRKVEDYAFAEELSPEDRDSICRVIGHFAYHTKRRLQIDNFLANQNIELLKSCKHLPEDILEEVKTHEVKTLINVPMDKRSKKSNLKKIISDKELLTKEIELLNIDTKIDTK